MNPAVAPLARGWCPGVARPMATGDGLLARVHPRHGILSLAQARGLAGVAARHGNGLLDITSHGNLQIRGLSPEAHEPAAAALRALGLADPGARAPYRATVVSPLAGLDPAEPVNGLALADAVEELARAVVLPPKFLIAVDSGGAFGLDHLAPDVWARAGADGAVRLGLGGVPVLWARALPRAGLAAALSALLAALVAALAACGARRAPGLPAAARHRLLPGGGPLVHPARPPLKAGAVRLADGALGLLATAPFGRLPAAALARLADLAAGLGVPELRLTPHRGVLLPGVAPGAAEAVRARLEGLGFVTDPRDPRLRLVTCAGAPACASALCETHGHADRLAAVLPPGPGAVHLSACAKGCATRGAAALTLVARDTDFAVILDGGPLDPPAAHLSFAEIAARLAGAADIHHAFQGKPARS